MMMEDHTMPCNDGGPTPAEQAQQRIDHLAAENDQLREVILDCINRDLIRISDDRDFRDHTYGVDQRGPWIGMTFWQKISADQVEHRAEDLDRLETVIRTNLQRFNPLDANDARIGINRATYARSDLQQMLGAVLTADPGVPLRPQLGFDPDQL